MRTTIMLLAAVALTIAAAPAAGADPTGATHE